MSNKEDKCPAAAGASLSRRPRKIDHAVPQETKSRTCERIGLRKSRTSLADGESVHENNAGSHLSACALCVVLRARGQHGHVAALGTGGRVGEAPFVLQVN
jgi:hypothetical protein